MIGEQPIVKVAYLRPNQPLGGSDRLIGGFEGFEEGNSQKPVDTLSKASLSPLCSPRSPTLFEFCQVKNEHSQLLTPYKPRSCLRTW